MTADPRVRTFRVRSMPRNPGMPFARLIAMPSRCRILVVFVALLGAADAFAPPTNGPGVECPFQEVDPHLGERHLKSDDVQVIRTRPGVDPLKHPFLKVEPGTNRYLNGLLVETAKGEKILILGTSLSSHERAKRHLEGAVDISIKTVLWSGEMEFKNDGMTTCLARANETSGMVARNGYKDSSVKNLQDYLAATRHVPHDKAEFLTWAKTDQKNPHLDARFNGHDSENFRHDVHADLANLKGYLDMMRDPGEDPQYRKELKLRFTVTYDKPDSLHFFLKGVTEHLDISTNGVLTKAEQRILRRAFTKLRVGDDIDDADWRVIDNFYDRFYQHHDNHLVLAA